MIAGYAASASVWPGANLVLHVSTDARRFRVVIYLWNVALRHVLTGQWLKGVHVQESSADADWNWPGYAVSIPSTFPSGVYIAHLEEPGGEAVSVTMRHSAVLFVVRAPSPRPILYKLPLATYNAYNIAGGGCFYDNPPHSDQWSGAKLSFRRPGCGIGGPVFGPQDHYAPSSSRRTFAHWDAPFITWLNQHRYDVAYCTDLDIHADPDLCSGHRLLLSVGHDEYWSAPMRDGVARFIANGGNAAFFSANVCWWRIHLVDGGGAMTCHQGGPAGAHDHWWTESGVNRPEDSLTGQSYRHGGGWWDGPRAARSYVVDEPDHWVFAGTGLRAGDKFGGEAAPRDCGRAAETASTGGPILDQNLCADAAAMADESALASASHRCEAGLGARGFGGAGLGCETGLAEAGPQCAPGFAEAGPGCASGFVGVGKHIASQEMCADHDEQQRSCSVATPLAGYECDGVPIVIDEHNRAALHRDAHRCGTPHGLRVLAHSLLDEHWQDLPAREVFLANSPHCAAMSIYSKGGTVFAAGTTDWVRSLQTGSDTVAIVTLNVLERLQAEKCMQFNSGAATGDRR